MRSPLRRCRLCRRWRLWPAFRFLGDERGVSRRCRDCRRRTRQRDPALPPALYIISRHACERYIERVAPGLTIGEARRELIRRMWSVRSALPGPAPAWARYEHDDRNRGFLILDEQTVVVLRANDGRAMDMRDVIYRDRVAITVLTRADAPRRRVGPEVSWR